MTERLNTENVEKLRSLLSGTDAGQARLPVEELRLLVDEVLGARDEIERLKDESPGWNGAHEVLKQDYATVEHERDEARASLARVTEELGVERSALTFHLKELDKTRASLARVTEERDEARASTNSNRDHYRIAFDRVQNLEAEVTRLREEGARREEAMREIVTALEDVQEFGFESYRKVGRWILTRIRALPVPSAPPGPAVDPFRFLEATNGANACDPVDPPRSSVEDAAPRIASRLTGWTPRDLKEIDNPALEDAEREAERAGLSTPKALVAAPTPKEDAPRCAACEAERQSMGLLGYRVVVGNDAHDCARGTGRASPAEGGKP